VSDYQSRGQGGWPDQPPGRSGYGHESTQPLGEETRQQPWLAPVPPVPGTPLRQVAPGHRRPRRRWPVVLTVVVVVVLVLLGIGDQIAKSYAQGRIAQQVQKSAHLSAEPAVSIEGWPFLTQALSRNVSAIDISANNVTADGGKLPFNFTAKATGVHVNSSFNRVTISHINGQAVVTFDAASSLLDVPAGSITLSADPAKGPDAIQATSMLGTLYGTVKLADPNHITVALGAGTGLGSLVSGLTGNSFTITVPTLPAGLVVHSVSVNGQGIVAQASAANSTLAS
jgi:hypothetical protein